MARSRASFFQVRAVDLRIDTAITCRMQAQAPTPLASGLNMQSPPVMAGESVFAARLTGMTDENEAANDLDTNQFSSFGPGDKWIVAR